MNRFQFKYLTFTFLFAMGMYIFVYGFTVHVISTKCGTVQMESRYEPAKNSSLPVRQDNATKITVLVGQVASKCEKPAKADDMPLFKDISYYERRNVASVLFPIVLDNDAIGTGTYSEKTHVQRPGEAPTTAHFVWCGKKVFRFEDHLALISIIKILYPQQIFFHYNELPVMDARYYNTWFQELKQSVPFLTLKKTDVPLTCNTTKPLEFGLEQLAATSGGGVLFGERTFLTRIPEAMRTTGVVSYFTGSENAEKSRGYVISTKGNLNEMNVYMSDFERFVKTHALKCVTVKEFNDQIEAMSSSSSPIRISDIPVCVIEEKGFFPKDIFNSSTPFDTVARWIYYGKSERIQPAKDVNNSDRIPLISHYICLKPHGSDKHVYWSFGAYVSVLSALYVAGFERIYVHGDEEPLGEWWEKLKSENVTFVKLEKVQSVFQQSVKEPAHVSDIIRVQVMLKYGGIYQDWNVLWVNPVPEEDLHYETVLCMDWPTRGEWPDSLQFGILLCKPGSEFLKMVARSFSFYQDTWWAFNALLFPYRIYERNPETLFVDRKLQVTNYNDISHPVWGDDYLRDLLNASKTMDFSWREVSAFHFTNPKWHKSISSYQGVKYGKDLFTKMGRRVFEKAGRLHELDAV